MKVVALYHPESDHSRSVITFQNDFEKRTGNSIELVSLETIEGASMAKLYGITSYPVILVTTDDGRMEQLWQGNQLPLIDEVAGYIISH